MLVDEVARPQEISLASGTRLKSTAERRSGAFLGLLMLRTRGSRHLHEERAVARTTLYSSGAREAGAGAGTSPSLLNGLAYQTAWGLLASIPSVLQAR